MFLSYPQTGHLASLKAALRIAADYWAKFLPSSQDSLNKPYMMEDKGMPGYLSRFYELVFYQSSLLRYDDPPQDLLVRLLPTLPIDVASSSTANAYAILGSPRQRISTQIEMALAAVIPLNPTINDLPPIVVSGRRYVLEPQLARQKGRGRSSWIRDHGDFLVEVIQGRAAASYWSCRRCDSRGSPRIFSAAATTAT
ncbi:transposase-like protein [Colletotrichum musicola]|uniref:Transposase-like protein n=1 Tax=Colletotrichum musicola TaxID=2175873 RepID=A0A8H6KH78_9PEZI|nr:transposase-like protein [Colletotrichum musicola]